MWLMLWQERKFLFWVWALALCVRVIVFECHTTQDDNCMLAWDSEQYENVAVNILQGNGIATSPGVPNFYRLPEYPVFLAGLYKIFGVNRITAMRVQTILASVAPVLIFALSLALFPGALLAAKIAACLAAVHIGFVLYAGILSTESLFLLLFLLFCICFLKNKYVCAGFWLGIASLVRPVGHYVVVLVLVGWVVVWVIERYRNGSRAPLRQAQGPQDDKKTLSSKTYQNHVRQLEPILSSWGPNAMRQPGIHLLPLIWLITVAPWLIRNFILTGYLFFHTLPGLHFLQYSAAGVIEARDQCSYFQARDTLFAQWHEACDKNLNEYERNAVAEKLAFKTIFQHPVFAAQHALTQMARTCCTLYSTLLLYVPQGTVYGSSLWHKIKLYLFPNALQPWLKIIVYEELLLSLVMILGVLLFCCALVCNHMLWASTLFMGTMSLFFIVITLSYGCARLRMQADTFLIVAAAYGWAWAVQWYRKRSA